MLYSKTKKEALDIHKRAVDKYNCIVKDVQRKGEQLYASRKESVIRIELSENLINSISNTPKEFSRKLLSIETQCIKFRDTEKYAQEACDSAVKSGVSIAAGVGAGATVAAMAPTAAMWVATTFGTASTGTAISALSGAVATKAALAWLGGGALAAGGAGIAGGQALLALAGPIGWGISAVTTGTSIFLHAKKNKKISNEAIDEAKKITFAGAQLNETGAKIEQINDKTVLLMDGLEQQLIELRSKKNYNYTDLTADEQLQLGTLVNNTLALAELLNETVE